MIGLAIVWLIYAAVFYFVSMIVPGVSVDGFGTAMLLALVFWLLNVFVKPFILLLTLPITVLTLGLFLIVINAGMILEAANIVDGFVVDSFGWAVLYSVILSLVFMVFKSH
ncbi:hypothetical protein COT97_05545 [Candidatus Falkowbacteria bacterium CG10_big_fil_rev_8_21_14_0_10_39_11]|uniref:Phage holin family protein n=1 Tax=Candidatus Falkowbacteria bacterium CG10_big_fil_rev_8_21_14_0_10_39_11 TaxID=1974565 RepID=A0A2H0V3G2_9BACT|nr:MAG: hypothetical protein COT97_05545 [Candidatus Falkowbacteria bacterium CG10_big_fil_rev_8_21_14_0_10_39_11]